VKELAVVVGSGGLEVTVVVLVLVCACERVVYQEHDGWIADERDAYGELAAVTPRVSACRSLVLVVLV
jgi:hypothetical protein